MKFQFEDDLDYQIKAISAVVDLFKGQEKTRSEFTVTAPPKLKDQKEFDYGSTLGVGNRLELLDEEILKNLRDVQLRNGLAPSESLTSGDFTVEMETGTGKTYVYLRTIFELNKHYGFTKFVIVVPSVAIKEGVNQTLKDTREHFGNLYPAAKTIRFFQYDSSRMSAISEFARSDKIQIMITTVGAINKKDVNNLYKAHEGTGGERPVDLIRATRPILIVDEPQSVDGGMQGKGREALESMRPLCTLRYSATHLDKYHMVYSLNAVDAYEKGLVKQIEVASLEVEDGYNKPRVKLVETQNVRNLLTAKLELDVLNGKNVKRKTVQVKDGDDLEQITNREIYRDMRVGTITWGKDAPEQTAEIKGKGLEYTLKRGETLNDVNPDAIKRQMIRRTIQEHFEKELAFKRKGVQVKVLSLFFIDSVKNYRAYDEAGNEIPGKFALMFEEEYLKLARSEKYQTLFEKIDLDTDVSEVHNGYFSIDKNKQWQEFAVAANGQIRNNAVNRENAERAYNLIMKEKGKLLRFDTKLRFIFSHSALKEGWDNPNVFQICTLRDIGSELARRQTIGRGLRLCVNQGGKRLRDNQINTLTVMATESYEDFARTLQKEIEKETGVKFGVIDKDRFAPLLFEDENGEVKPVGVDRSKQLWNFLKQEEYIDGKGKVQDKLRAALKDNTLELPKTFDDIAPQVKEALRKSAGKLDIKNADDRKTIRVNKAMLLSSEFQALWERIKYKTAYRVAFDTEKLVADAAKAIDNALPITETRAAFRKADVQIGEAGISTKETDRSGFTAVKEEDIELPDILTNLQDETGLTRSSIVAILRQCHRLDDFTRNPQQFLTYCREAINRTKRQALVDGIRYQKLGDEFYYAQELFEAEELKGYLHNTLDAQKSVYEQVVYDSAGIEKSFAEDLERNEAVKVYAKLPGWFTVPTPLGSYNPDWAVVVEKDGQERVYFVAETKGSLWADDLRLHESAKIKCGKKHFEELAQHTPDTPAKYAQVANVQDMMGYVG